MSKNVMTVCCCNQSCPHGRLVPLSDAWVVFAQLNMSIPPDNCRNLCEGFICTDCYTMIALHKLDINHLDIASRTSEDPARKARQIRHPYFVKLTSEWNML